MTTQQIRFRLPKEDLETLDNLAAGAASRQSIAAMILHAACEAIRKSPGRLSFPPKFAVAETGADTRQNAVPVRPAETKPRRYAARALEALARAGLGNASPGQTSAQIRSLHDDGTSVIEAVNLFLLAKARSGRSDRYLRQLRVVMMQFAAGRARRPVSSVTAGEIEKWLEEGEWAARTQRGYLSDVRTLFNFLARRGVVERSPAAGVELPVLDDFSAPKIHTPDQVLKVLEAARVRDLDVCRHLAIRYFAGLRSAEAHRIGEDNVMLDRGVIEVPASKAKTRRRRLVTIQPNLRAWLELGGELRPMSPSRSVRPVIRASRVEWHHNVTRHSFVSYHLAKFQNAARTALEAGHTEAMVFQHYRELVAPMDAEAFWQIVPSAGE